MIQYIETHITESCNLKCIGCSHFSGFAKPQHKDIGDFRKEFGRLAEIEDIRTIRLMGGEPLLNPDFMEYLRIARNHFPNSDVVLVTNGILSDRLCENWNELQALRISVCVSDYHLDNQNLSLAAVRHDKGQLYNISLDPAGGQDKDVAFEYCDLHRNSWYFFRDGRLYPCCIAGCIQTFLDHFGLDWGFTQEDLSIDIFDHTTEEIEDFVRHPVELCRYCDTVRRAHSYRPFERSKGDIKEWTI